MPTRSRTAIASLPSSSAGGRFGPLSLFAAVTHKAYRFPTRGRALPGGDDGVTLSVPGSPFLYSYVQNVARARARACSIEFALDRGNVVPRFDLAGSVTYTDAKTRENAIFPAAVGKMLPSVPRWKATAVATWRPDDTIMFTAAARHTSRNWGTLDNSDVIGNTWQGFYKYLVIDARAQFRIEAHYRFALGVDNLTNDKYFLFHPFPQRSVMAEVTMRL